MSFPFSRPRKLAGTILAKIRTECLNKSDFAPDSPYLDTHYLYVTYCRNGFFHIWYFSRSCQTDDLSDAVFLCGSQDLSIIDDVVTWLQYLDEKFCHSPVELEVPNRTAQEKAFADRFWKTYPDLVELYLSNQEENSLFAADNMPMRPVLPRGEWMAKHYPQHVAG